MPKRHAHHLSNAFRKIHPSIFLVIALAATVSSVLALRANNEHMVKLRAAVYAADKAGTDVQTPLKNLQAYVTSHMNTNLSTSTSVYPPIQLKYTYDRLVQAQGDAVANANSDLYTEAQAYCESQNSVDFSGRNRVPCIESYVQARNPKLLPPIQDSLYKFSFISPRWSPDLAGWSVLTAGLGYLRFIVSVATRRWL